jgi:hypothetical protein
MLEEEELQQKMPFMSIGCTWCRKGIRGVQYWRSVINVNGLLGPKHTWTQVVLAEVM